MSATEKCSLGSDIWIEAPDLCDCLFELHSKYSSSDGYERAAGDPWTFILNVFVGCGQLRINALCHVHGLSRGRRDQPT